MSIFLYGIYLFAFIFCILTLCKNVYAVVKAWVLKTNKQISYDKESIIFMGALSFVITALIIGL